MNKHILLLGAGRSSAGFIDYTAKWTRDSNTLFTILDTDNEALLQKTRAYPHIQTLCIPSEDALTHIENAIYKADIVISLLPVNFHPPVASICLRLGKHFATASYVGPEIQAMADEIIQKKLCFLFEMGVDPGIDHMTAMQLIYSREHKYIEPLSFESYTGALMTKETLKNNPWNYLFSWNPRNVVIAGQGEMSVYWQHNNAVLTPYHRLFAHTKALAIPQNGTFEAYPNRNSLPYISYYGLDNIPTLIRGTLRYPVFCDAWNILVQLGATNDQTIIDWGQKCSAQSFWNSFVPNPKVYENKEKLSQFLHLKIDEKMWEAFVILLHANADTLLEGRKTPAQQLESLLLPLWQMKADDKDMVLMYHRLVYKSKNTCYLAEGIMKLEGENKEKTAISDTVGLPLAIGTRLLFEDKFTLAGIHRPTHPDLYQPILKELTQYGITMHIFEKETSDYE
jgi:saccharopine dehydrogenase-like NADP-dependent oxidoreductase